MCGVIPVISLYLKGIEGLSGIDVGIILSMATAAAVVAPLVSVYVADRFIRSERLYALCNIVSSVLLFFLRLQNDFLPITVIYLLLMLFLTPATALINIMVFNYLGQDRRRYGGIRVWGTFGWIFMSVFFSYFWLGNAFFSSVSRSMGDILFFSSATAMFLGIYSLSFGREKRLTDRVPVLTGTGIKKGKTENEGGEAGRRKESGGGLSLFAAGLKGPDRKRFFIFLFIGFSISVVDKYYYLGLSPFLRQAGIKDAWIMPVISSGNISEIFLMFFLFRIITVFGFKKTLAAGAAAEIIRFTLFACSEKLVPVLAGILVHGATYALFSAAAFIYLDMYSTERSRTSNHLVYSFIISGGSNLFGNLAGGIILDLSLHEAGNYSFFWAVPAIISLLSLIMVVIFIEGRKPLFQENN